MGQAGQRNFEKQVSGRMAKIEKNNAEQDSSIGTATNITKLLTKIKKDFHFRHTCVIMAKYAEERPILRRIFE